MSCTLDASALKLFIRSYFRFRELNIISFEENAPLMQKQVSPFAG